MAAVQSHNATVDGVKNGKTRCGATPERVCNAIQSAATRFVCGEELVQILVQFFRQLLAANALVMTFYSSCQLALALCSWLFVKFTCTQLSQQTCFFNSALEATHRNFEGLIFFKTNCGHVNSNQVCVGKNEIIAGKTNKWKSYPAMF